MLGFTASDKPSGQSSDSELKFHKFNSRFGIAPEHLQEKTNIILRDMMTNQVTKSREIIRKLQSAKKKIESFKELTHTIQFQLKWIMERMRNPQAHLQKNACLGDLYYL